SGAATQPPPGSSMPTPSWSRPSWCPVGRAGAGVGEADPLEAVAGDGCVLPGCDGRVEPLGAAAITPSSSGLPATGGKADGVAVVAAGDGVTDGDAVGGDGT